MDQKTRLSNRPGFFMKILWANLHCLVDQTSGASISVRTMLKGLQSQGHEVAVLGASNFDRINPDNKVVRYFKHNEDKNLLKLNDDGLQHVVVRSASGSSKTMTSDELWDWVALTENFLDRMAPDLVMFYGAKTAEQWLARECFLRGIPTVKYLVNERFTYEKFAKYISALITDTQFTANLYRERFGLDVKPVGKFISREVVAGNAEPVYVTMINPTAEKGGVLALQIVALLHAKGHRVKVQFVSSRGDLSQAKSLATAAKADLNGLDESLVYDRPRREDMAEIYRTTDVLLVPSLWQESGARVIAEALLNHIPVVASDRGGNAELVGTAGMVVNVPADVCVPPYKKAAPSSCVESFVNALLSVMAERRKGSLGDLKRAIEKESKRFCMDVNISKLSAHLVDIVGNKNKLIGGT